MVDAQERSPMIPCPQYEIWQYCPAWKQIRKEERDKVLTEKRIDYLRSLGWMVAVHNDYKQNGEFHTFWLLTYPDGKYLKGEGKTDEEALEQIVEELRQAGEPCRPIK